MRLFFAGIMHETSSFSPVPTNVASFEHETWLPEDDPDCKQLASLFLVGDIYKAIVERGHEFAPGPIVAAQPSGPMVRHGYETLRDRLLDHLRKAVPVDAVFLFLHGAMFADGYDDCEGDLLSRVREIVGPNMPVGALLDLHGNIGPEMLKHASALVACKEYPHTDFAPRALELLSLLEKAVIDDLDLCMSCRHLPMLAMFHTTKQPARAFVDRIMALETGNILSISLMHGFPWADLPITGSNVIVVTDKSHRNEGAALAEQLARDFWAMRAEGGSTELDVAAAVAAALAAPEGPVVIADTTDNPGGGAPGDSTFILRELLHKGARDCALGTLYDPEAIRLCELAEEGARVPLRIGGKTSPQSGDPVDINATIRRIAHFQDGKVTTVWVEHQGIDIVLSNLRAQVFQPSTFTDLGIDPASRRIVVVKSSQHFHAGFAPIAKQIIYCSAPGSLTRQFDQLPFQRLRRPIWPLDAMEDLPLSS